MLATTRSVISSFAFKRKLVVPTVSMAVSSRQFSFSFAGPKKLDDILKKELIENKNTTEISDLWYTYHEGKVREFYCCFVCQQNRTFQYYL